MGKSRKLDSCSVRSELAPWLGRRELGEHLHTLADTRAGLSGWKGWGRIASLAEETGQRHGSFGDVHGAS